MILWFFQYSTGSLSLARGKIHKEAAEDTENFVRTAAERTTLRRDDETCRRYCEKIMKYRKFLLHYVYQCGIVLYRYFKKRGDTRDENFFTSPAWWFGRHDLSGWALDSQRSLKTGSHAVGVDFSFSANRASARWRYEPGPAAGIAAAAIPYWLVEKQKAVRPVP